MSKKLVIGFTGPSMFSPKIQQMVEKSFDAIPLSLNQNKPEDLIYFLQQVNAIILPGGVDICPTSFGCQITNHDDFTSFDFDRDKREIFIFNWAQQNNIPILGICRGHQIIGKINGLPFLNNINQSKICHNPVSKKIDVGETPVHFLYIHDDFKKEFFNKSFINSFHHQAVGFIKTFDYLKDFGINVMGTSPLDYEGNSIIELMKSTDDSWISCQWHPENDYESNEASGKLIKYFKRLIHCNEN